MDSGIDWSQIVEMVKMFFSKDLVLFGSAFALFLVITILQWRYFDYILRRNDEEIKRITASRDKLEDVILKDRLSSKDSQKRILKRIANVEKQFEKPKKGG